MMRILITGGCGFLGANLAQRAISEGHKIQIVDNLCRLGSEENLQWLKNQGEFVFTQGDVSVFEMIEKVISSFKPEVVFHVAGQVAMTTSIENPIIDFKTNALGTLNVLESVRKHCPECRIIYSSTNKVYGDLEYLVYDETETRYIARDYPNGFDENLKLDFCSPYGCSKGSADQYMLDYHRIYGLNTVVFRHSSIYGGRQFSNYDQGWVGWFCQKAIETSNDLNTLFSISGTGKQVRDVLYASDLVNAYFAVLDNIDSVAGQVFNLGGGIDNSLSLIELFSMLEEMLNVKLNYHNFAWRQSDQKVFVAHNGKAKRFLGWEPKISKDLGLRKMLNWCKDVNFKKY